MKIQDIFDKHIKEDINIFPYQLQKSFDNFSNSERKLYEIAFKNGLRFLNKSNYTKKYLPKGYNSNYWSIKDVDNNGNLRIYNQIQEKILKRF